jgi:hypothetical protein
LVSGAEPKARNRAKKMTKFRALTMIQNRLIVRPPAG